MTDNPYLQFPLCALAFGENLNVRLTAILDFSVVEAGTKLSNKLPAGERRTFVLQQTQSPIIPSDFNEQSPLHWAALYGSEIVCVRFARLVPVIKNFRCLKEFVTDFESRQGRDALVRIRRRWLFATRDHEGLTYPEFSVLCGIYSALGDKAMAKITRERIRRCALGYRTAAIMQAELTHRHDSAIPLTERRLRDTIARLHRNKFFARCTVARRITYYSIRLDNEALRKKVLARRAYPEFFRTSQAAQDKSLTAAIKQLRDKSVQT